MDLDDSFYKCVNFNWTTYFEFRRSQEQRKVKEGTLLMLGPVLKYLCCDVPLRCNYSTSCAICDRARSIGLHTAGQQAVALGCGQRLT